MSRGKVELDPAIAAKIDNLDLAKCEERLQHPDLGEGWTAEKARQMIKEYRHFLKLVALGGMVVPTRETDIVWHTAILDTKEYMRSCMDIFGRYIHHMPYMDKVELDEAWKKSCQNSKEVLGREYVVKTDV